MFYLTMRDGYGFVRQAELCIAATRGERSLLPPTGRSSGTWISIEAGVAAGHNVIMRGSSRHSWVHGSQRLWLEQRVQLSRGTGGAMRRTVPSAARDGGKR
jgi:hypothetical protein